MLDAKRCGERTRQDEVRARARKVQIGALREHVGRARSRRMDEGRNLATLDQNDGNGRDEGKETHPEGRAHAPSFTPFGDMHVT
jgi:hypothetical protein